MTQDIIWSKSQMNIERRQEILSQTNTASTNDTPEGLDCLPHPPSETGRMSIKSTHPQLRL